MEISKKELENKEVNSYLLGLATMGIIIITILGVSFILQ